MSAFLPVIEWLSQISTPPAPTPAPTPTFWAANSDKIIVAVVTAILVLLLSEPLKALLKKMGGWLERAWQALGFGFKKRYLKALGEQHQWLKLIGIYSETEKVQPRLQNVFVSLRLAGDTDAEGPRFAWEKLFAGKEKHLVILGHPGAGKSTLLDYLILVLTGRISHSLLKRLGSPLPLFAHLKYLGIPGQPDTLLDLLQAPSGLGMDTAAPRGFFESRLRHGNCVVLLDGLDEVLDPRLHREAAHKIIRFANTYSDNWIIVTCRVAGWHNQLPGFHPYEVQDFDEDDIQRFIVNWYREVLCAQEMRKLKPDALPQEKTNIEQRTIPQADQAVGRLWQALRANTDLLRIARTPLILSLITLVHKNRRDLPQGRAKLYGECLEVLLETWDKKDKDLDSPNSPSLKSKLLVLQTIALHFLQLNLLEMDSAGLEALVQPLMPRITPTREPLTAVDLIRQIYERSGVLEEKALRRYGFAHRALHDYLAAQAVVEENQDDLLLAHATEERWREVILIAAWLAPEQRRNILIEALACQGGENAASLALAGWSLAEGAPVDEHIRVEVKERLLAGLDTAQSAGDLGLLSGALLTSDPAAAQDWIFNALTSGNPQVKQHVLELLPDFEAQATAELIPVLTHLLVEPKEAPSLRAAAALALAKFNPELTDSALWNALQAARQPENPASLKAAAAWALCELNRYNELGMVKVLAGEFMMGSDKAKDSAPYDDELPQHRLYLPTFYIAKCPVTVSEWRAYLQASGYKPEHTLSLQGLDNHPVCYVTWREALAYAQWHGLGLPSEAEWEKAARGTEGRIYPWGDAWQAGRANTDEMWQSSTGGRLRRLFRRDVTGTTTPVRQFSPQGDSPYGCSDMAGNVLEWTRSIFATYPYQPNDGREELMSEDSRVLRGGSCIVNRRLARCAFRGRYLPLLWSDTGGFRVGVVSPILISEL